MWAKHGSKKIRCADKAFEKQQIFFARFETFFISVRTNCQLEHGKISEGGRPGIDLVANRWAAASIVGPALSVPHINEEKKWQRLRSGWLRITT